MVKPEYCKICRSTKLEYKENNPVFNPDTDEEESYNSWKCLCCGTIHVDTKEFSFIQKEIETNKLLQTTNTNINFD